MALLVAAQLWIAKAEKDAFEWLAKLAAAIVFIVAAYAVGAFQTTFSTTSSVM